VRFTVSYKLNKLDQSYRMAVYSLIKEAIRTVDHQYYEKIFIRSDYKIKPFTFSAYLHNFSLKDTTIYLNQITITISSSDMEFSVHAFNGIRRMKEFKVGQETWVQSHIQLLQECKITNRKVKFQTLSPILIEDKDGKPLSPRDSNFERELNYFANLQAQEIEGRDLYDHLTFTPIQMKKTVIKEKNRHLEKDSFLYFTAYRGMFMLEGNPQDLQLFYQIGLGKRSTYFGLLEYVGEGV
jgi:CRISPR-associated endoribonuclease Cas6